MSKAKGKPKTPVASTNPTNTVGAWEASLASTLINDDTLNVVIHLLSPEKVEDKLQLQVLGGSVETNVRQKFIYIDKDTLIAQGKEYGKSKDSGSKTGFPEVFALLKGGDDTLTSSVLAKLLKVKILDYRDAELERRDEAAQKTSGHASRSPAKSMSPDKGKKDKKGGKKSPTKKPGEGGNVIEADAEIPRGKCPLKKRGEEKEEPAKIEDYPEGGPDLYVLCVGFELPDFLAECHKTNLPITSLIRTSSTEYSSDVAFLDHLTANIGPKVVISDDEISNGMVAKVAACQTTIDTFWDEIKEQASDVPLPAYLVDVGFEAMKLPHLVLDAEIKKDNEKMEEIKLDVYQHVAQKVYSLHNAYSQFLQYNKGMELINVVDLTEKNEEGELLYPLDMRYYSKTISLLPYESVTHLSVLNVMLEQVCKENQGDSPEIKEQTVDPVKKQLGKMIQSLPLTLRQQTEFEGFLALKRDKEEKDDQPTVLKAGDDIGSKNFHLNPNLYPLNDRSLLKASLTNSLLDLPKATPDILAKIQSLAYETETFCGEASHTVVKKALRQFAFENCDLSKSGPGVSPLKPSEEYYWDIELLLRAAEDGDTSLDKLKAIEIPEPRMKLDNYTFRTSYDKDALLQVLSEALYEYPYCQRIYHRHEHAMLLLFHAGWDESRESGSEWGERVHTDIGFHYFMSRTRDKFSSLIGSLPPLTPAPAPSEATAPPTPVTPAVEETEEEPEFQMPTNRLEGFKKRSQLKEEEKERVPTGKKGAKSKSAEKKGAARKGSPSPKRKGSPSKSPKRSGPPSRQSSAKSEKTKVEFDPVPLVPEPEVDIILAEDTGRNIFVGFKLPNQQVLEAGGQVAHCHPADGSVVRVEKWAFDGDKPKSRISVMKDGHVLSMNYCLKSDMDLKMEKKIAEEKRKAAEAALEAATEGEDAASPDSTASHVTGPEEGATPLAKKSSFNAQLKSGLCLSYKKPSKEPIKTVKLNEVNEEGEQEVEEEEEKEKDLETLMTISIPTGLVVEYCQEQPNQDYFAIRQCYESESSLRQKCEETAANACAAEASRLYLSNGTVVKHMKNGQTVVLYPDGGYSIKHLAPPVATPTPLPPTDIGSSVGTPGLGEEGDPAPPPAPPHLVWDITHAEGKREHVMSNGETVEIPPLQCYSATDPESKEVMFTRIDSTLSVSRPDGTRIVDHTDGTRITTYTTDTDGVMYKVECVGYATLHFSATTSETIFGTPTRITSTRNNTFSVKDEDGSTLEINPLLNEVKFSSKPLTVSTYNPEHLRNEHSELQPSALGVHKFQLDEEICFEHTDVAGNIFNVSYEGKISKELANTHIVQNLDSFYREQEIGAYHEVEEKHKPSMRLFVVHSDNTGTELMDMSKCKALFDAPGNNPDIVKVEEDVESDELARGYTFLTPFYASPGAKWTTEFDEGNIVPGGLIYDGNVRAPEQIMGGWEKRASSPIVTEPELPPAIHYHQVIEETMLDDYKRQLVVNGLRAHAKWMEEQELHSNKAAFPDERPENEKQTAASLASKVGTHASPNLPSKVHNLWRSESKQCQEYEAWLRAQEDVGVESEEEEEEEEGQGDGEVPPVDMLEKRRNTVDSVTRKYSTAVSHNPFKMKMKLKKGIIPQAKWDTIMREKMEVNILKSDLRHFRVPPYFESKFGEAFLISLKDGPDMNPLSAHVPSPIEKVPSIEKASSDKSLAGKGESLSTSMILIDDQGGSNISLPQLGTTPRPGNPTPSVAKTGAEELQHKETKHGSPSAEEPSPRSNRNLSPHGEEIETPTHDLLSSRQNSKPTSGTVKSLHVDVKGDPRTSRVRIPRSIRGYKPGSEPNERFLAQEEPVRRGVKTSSVLAAAKRKGINEMRGFQVYPPEVSFGVLCPNGMYATTVTLKNIGIDSCRFHIKCPRNSDGVSVTLHSETNFVAAGMSVKFDVCIKARDVTEIGHVSMDIAIVMETEVFHLPVLATVLPTQEYNERSRSGRLTRLPQHIKIIDVSSVLNSSSSGVVSRSRDAQRKAIA